MGEKQERYLLHKGRIQAARGADWVAYGVFTIEVESMGKDMEMGRSDSQGKDVSMESGSWRTTNTHRDA